MPVFKTIVSSFGSYWENDAPAKSTENIFWHFYDTIKSSTIIVGIVISAGSSLCQSFSGSKAYQVLIGQTCLAAIQTGKSRSLLIRLRCKMKTKTNITRGGTQQIFEEMVFPQYLFGGLQPQSIYLWAVNILLSIASFLVLFTYKLSPFFNNVNVRHSHDR